MVSKHLHAATAASAKETLVTAMWADGEVNRQAVFPGAYNAGSRLTVYDLVEE